MQIAAQNCKLLQKLISMQDGIGIDRVDWRYLILRSNYMFNLAIIQNINREQSMQLKQTHLSNNAHHNNNSTNEQVNFQQYNYQYYEEYKRLYQTAYLLSLQLKQLAKGKEDIENKLVKVQKKNEDFKDDQKGENNQRKKRFRRTAQTIQRRFVCQVQRCNKCYGSDGSLQQHIKLKHPQLYQSKSINRKDEVSHQEEDYISSSLS